MDRVLQSDVDLREVFASRYLQGLYHLKPIPQTTDYTCGAAAVATAVRFLGKEANEGQCAQALKTDPVVGTTPENMLRYLRTRGFKARAFTDTPFDTIVGRCRMGDVTLVDWADWGGHWVIVAGIEPRMQVIVLADPARPRSCFAAHTFARFQKHWHCDDFGQGAPGGRYHQLAVFVDKYKTTETNHGGQRALRKDLVHSDMRIRSYKHLYRDRSLDRARK